MLPTSSLVFAVVAAVPFGLAIKDTVSGKYDEPRVFAGRPDNDDDAADALERYGEEEQAIREQALEAFRNRHSTGDEVERLARLDEMEAAARAVPHESFDGLFGAEVATIGSRFGKLVLGGAKGAHDVSELWPDHDVVLLDDGVTTHTLYLKINADDRVCDALRVELVQAWGRETDQTWYNAALGQRALVETSNGCALKFEKAVAVDQWLAKSATAVVPMSAIGRPAKQLTASLGARANVSPDGWISWTAPGLALGSGTTSITAYTKGGVVVGLFASVTANETTQDAVIEQITRLVGKDPEEGDKLIWKSVPAISVETGSQLFLRIGDQMGQRN